MVETWTYASTSSVTVDGDLTTKYTQGRKVKFTQNSTVKFFLVISSTYNGGTDKTTISLNGQGVYTVENLPITDNYSTAWDIPSGGFPFDYTSISKAGSLGIGILSPSELLHVYGSSYPKVLIESSGVNGGDLTLKSSGGSWQLYSQGADLRLWDSADRVTFEAGGNVGIGTTNPECPLHVVGNAYITGGLVGKDNTFIKIDYNTGKCMKREPTGEWCLLGDKVLTSVCCNSEKNIVGCNSSGECWQWDGEEWTQMVSAVGITQVACGSDGYLCGLDNDGNPNGRAWDGDSWEEIGGYVLSIAVKDASNIYCAGIDNFFYKHAGGTYWTGLETTTGITKISVAKDGSIFATLLSDGSLVKWSGTAWGSSLGAATGLKAIAAKSATMVWAVGSDDKLWYWNGLTWTKSSDDTVLDIAIANL